MPTLASPDTINSLHTKLFEPGYRHCDGPSGVKCASTSLRLFAPNLRVLVMTFETANFHALFEVMSGIQDEHDVKIRMAQVGVKNESLLF
jgi:hypothetical protein